MLITLVRLRKPARTMPFLCSDLELTRGEPCIVRTERGLEFGECAAKPEPCSEEDRKKLNMHVIRRVNDRDRATLERNEQDEAHARAVARRHIEQSGLPMKLVDVDYTFDRKKVTFYFTADERIDFRQLVRDLAHELKTRIELRHIQVRDQAKLVGGLGECGRVQCCCLWMKEFMPISMRMAKRQNLSLNPAKISGQCGRLMCCLSYENDMYEPRRKRKQTADSRPADDNEDRTPAPQEDADKTNEAAPETPPEEPARAQEDAQAAPNDERGEEAPRKRRRRRRRPRRDKNAPGDSGSS